MLILFKCYCKLGIVFYVKYECFIEGDDSFVRLIFWMFLLKEEEIEYGSFLKVVDNEWKLGIYGFVFL